MFLTEPDLRYAGPFKRLVEDYRRAGDAERVAKYVAGESDFAAYVRSLQLAARGVALPKGQVSYHTYWLVDDEDIIGVVRVRPQLTPEAERNDGHIGYDVAPSQRGKGYGAALLRLALVEARGLGLGRIVVTSLTANIPSRRIIERCGGRLIDVVTDDETGQPLSRYELETHTSSGQPRMGRLPTP
jgi:predicted acetyltransferase